MRGGVSMDSIFYVERNKYSPHAWGCFYFTKYKGYLEDVFPTCVGVFPSKSPNLFLSVSIPHMRGGVSSQMAGLNDAIQYSPHAWGCFLCINLVNAFLQSIPHMRGGVSP